MSNQRGIFCPPGKAPLSRQLERPRSKRAELFVLRSTNLCGHGATCPLVMALLSLPTLTQPRMSKE